MSMSPEDLAALIKQKYPDYQAVDDRELVSRIVSKYPGYQSQLPAFGVEGAAKLHGATPELVQHYLNLYDQFQQAGIKPIVKAGFRTAEQEYYLYTHGYPTKGNTGYGSKISPHQEGRAIDFSFAPDQRDKGRAILARYAQANGLHIPSDEPWHVAIPKGTTVPLSSGYERNPDPGVDLLSPASMQAWMESRGDIETFPQTGTELPSQLPSRVPEEPPTSTKPHSPATIAITPADIEWHLGIPIADASEWFVGLPKSKQAEVVQTINSAVAKDEAKKAAGITLTQSADYQARMRKRLRVAVPPRTVTPPSEPTALPKVGQVPSMSDVLADARRQGDTRSPEQINNDRLMEQAVKNVSTFTVDPTANVKSLYRAATKGAEGGFQVDVQEEFDRLKEAQARENTPEMVAARKRIGAVPESAMAPGMPSPRGIASAVQRFAGGAVKAIGGAAEAGSIVSGLGPVASYFGVNPIPAVRDYLNARGNVLEESASLPLNAQGEAIERSLPEKATDAVTGLGLSVAQLILLKKATGLNLGPLMALETTLKNSDRPTAERAVSAAQAYGMGKILDQHLSRPMSAIAFSAPTAVQTGLAYAQGNMKLEDALLQTGVEAGAGFLLGGKGEPKQYRHADFGVVTEAESQAGVPRGKLRVTDEQGVEHVIVKPSTVRNQRAIPLEKETTNAGQEQIFTETGSSSAARSQVGSEAGNVPRESEVDRLRDSSKTIQEKAITVPEEPSISAQPSERSKQPLPTEPTQLLPVITAEATPAAIPEQGASGLLDRAIARSETGEVRTSVRDVIAEIPEDARRRLAAISDNLGGIKTREAMDKALEGVSNAKAIKSDLYLVRDRAMGDDPWPNMFRAIREFDQSAATSPASGVSEPQPSLVSQVSSIVDERGNLTRGGDYINSLMKGRSDQDVTELLQWARTQGPNVQRFVGGNVIAELRTRGIDAQDIPFASQTPEAQNVPREPATQAAEPIRETRLPASQVTTGAETEVSIPDSDRTYRARYVVREAEDVVPSHNSQNFQPRSDYYHVNDRQYEREPQYQIQVLERSRSDKFNPRAVVNNSPTVEVGPPVIDADGNVLGGNSRAMIIQRVYEANDPVGRDAYRKLLLDQANLYGIDPSEVTAMKRPVLVRELSDSNIQRPEVQRIITELNRTSTTPLTAAEQSMTAARQLSEGATQFITDMLERGGEDATVATVMNESGPAIINKLIEDGIIQPGERNTLLKDGKATAEAKSRVENLLVSGIYRDLKQMEDTPSGIRRNIERLAVPLKTLAGTEWDIGDKVQTAIDAINEARGTTGGDLDILAKQVSMMREPYTADEIALAKTLRLGPRKTAEKFRRYAKDYSDAQSGGGLFGAPTRAESLKVHFGIDTIVRPDANPVVNEVSNRIIAAAEEGNLDNLSAAITQAPSEARMQIQGLAGEIAKEQTSGTEKPSIVGRVAEGGQEGAKVPEYDPSTANQSRPVSEVPAEPNTESADISERSLGPGAASASEQFPEVKERKFGARFVSDEEIAQDIRDQIGTAKYYEPIPNNVTATDAARLVEERGIPQSMNAIRDENNGIPFHARSAMGQIVIKKLNQLYRNLKSSESSDAEFVLDQATDMAEWQMDYGTRLGQGVQSFAMWIRLTPDGKLLTFKRAVDNARARHRAIAGDEVKEIVQEMNRPSAETAEPGQMELFEGNKIIKRAVAKRATKAKQDQDLTIWEEYKNAIAKQLFTFANPKAKADPPLQEFTDRLLSNVQGLIRQPDSAKTPDDVYGKLREVVENFDKYKDAWNEAVSYVRSKYDKKSVEELAAMEQRITDLHSAFQTRAFDRVLNSAIKQAEINFRDLAKAHYADRQRTRDDLIRDIQTNLGITLSPEDATELFARTSQALEARIIRARSNMLEGLVRKGNKTAKKVLPISDRIVEAARIGVFDEQKFYDAASERLGLPKYDQDVAGKILELAGHVEDAADGIPKDRAILGLNKYIAEQKGFGTEDLPLGIYYGNILSGYNTHIVNAIDTFMNVISEVNGLALTNPRAAAKIYGGMLRGLSEGGADALMALTEGRMKTEGKWMEAPRLMEIAQFGEKGGVPIQTATRLGRTAKAIAETRPATVLNAYKYVTRLLAASDTVFYQSSKEARAALLADRIGRAAGLTGDALNARVRDILALNRQEDFLTQAKSEGFEGSQAIVRANELRDMVRDAQIESQAVDFAGEATYNHEPHGALGYASKVISNWSQHFPPLKLFVPFTRIVANVTNRGLNYTPYGFKRAFGYGKVVEGRYQLFGEPATPEAQRLMLTRATLGTVGLTLLGGLQAAGVLTVHGGGPSDPERRRQLQQAGWRPYSIQVGDNFFSYVYTPIGLGLSVLGNMSDAERYHELEQKDAATRGAYAIARIGSTVFSQSFLSGLSRLFSALSDSPQESVTAVKQTLSSTASAMIAPNLAKDVYKLFDNKAYQSNTLMEDLVRNTPFAALVLKPQLNAFGEPVRVQRQRFLDVMTSDPAWRYVIDKGLRVPVPDRNTEIWKEQGRRITPEEYYELLQTSGPLLKQWIVEHQTRPVNPDPASGMAVPLSKMTDEQAQEALSKAASDIREPIINKIRVAGMVSWYEQHGASLPTKERGEALKTLRDLRLKMIGISEKTGNEVKPMKFSGSQADRQTLHSRLNKILAQGMSP